MVYRKASIRDGKTPGHQWAFFRKLAKLTNRIRSHINNIIQLPNGSKFSADVAFGGDGPTAPLPLNESGFIHQNLGSQEVRLIHDVIPKQRLREPKQWIYQYRNSADREWNSFYSLVEVEFFAEDFEVLNWWAPAKTLHRWTLLVVRFLREGEPLMFPHHVQESNTGSDVTIVGKVMLVNDAVKVNMGDKTRVIRRLASEIERREALEAYFGIFLTDEDFHSIEGWDMALRA